jgi:hypothetical protein
MAADRAKQRWCFVDDETDCETTLDEGNWRKVDELTGGRVAMSTCPILSPAG